MCDVTMMSRLPGVGEGWVGRGEEVFVGCWVGGFPMWVSTGSLLRRTIKLDPKKGGNITN